MSPPPDCATALVDIMPGAISSKQSAYDPAGEFSSISPPSSAYSAENLLYNNSHATLPVDNGKKSNNMNRSSPPSVHSSISVVSAHNQIPPPAADAPSLSGATRASTAATATAVTPADGATTVQAARARRKGLSATVLFERLLLRAESRATPDTFLNVGRQERVRETHLQAFEHSVVQDGMQITYELVVPTMEAEEIKKNAAQRKKKASKVEDLPALNLTVPDRQVATKEKIQIEMEIEIEEEEEETDMQEEIEEDDDDDELYSLDRSPERKRRTRFDRKHKHRNAAAEALANIVADARRERQADADAVRGRSPHTKRKKGLRSETRRARQEADADGDADEDSESGSDAGATSAVGDAGKNRNRNSVDRDEFSDSPPNPNIHAASGVVTSPIHASSLSFNKKGNLPSAPQTTPRNETDDEDRIEEISSTGNGNGNSNGNSNSNSKRKSKRAREGNGTPVRPRKRRAAAPQGGNGNSNDGDGEAGSTTQEAPHVATNEAEDDVLVVVENETGVLTCKLDGWQTKDREEMVERLCGKHGLERDDIAIHDDRFLRINNHNTQG